MSAFGRKRTWRIVNDTSLENSHGGVGGYVWLSTLQVQAHTYLSESATADEGVVTVAPEEIVLRFSEALRLTSVSIRGDGSPEQELGPLPLDYEFATHRPE